MDHDYYSALPIFHFSEYIKVNNPVDSLRTVIFGNFGAKNLGDEAILAGEIAELSKLDTDIIVVARNPKDIERIHHVKSISIYNFIAVARNLRKANFVIVGGGGIICKADRGLIGLVYQTYMLFLYFLMPYILGKKIYALGIGVYNNANPLILALSILFLKKASLVTVRDYVSYEHLKNKKVKVDIYKDNSFLMPLLPKDEILKDFNLLQYDKKKKHIGLALLRPDSTNDLKHLTQEILNLVKKYKDKANFWFYSCDYQNGYINDQDFGKILIERINIEIGKDVNCILVPTAWGPQNFFSSFNQMDYFITIRLHAAIFCYRNKIKFTGITYDHKTTSFLESIGKSPVGLAEFKADYVNI